MTNELLEKAKANITPRKVAKFVVGHSVRFVVSSAITSLVPADTKVDKTRLFIGSYALCGVISEKTTEWFDKEIDEYIEIWNTAETAKESFINTATK